MTREDDDVSRPPSSPPSSPGEEMGRQGDNESDNSPDSSVDTSEDSSEDLEEDLPDGFDLPRLRALQPCTAGPPHSCAEYCTITDEEERQIDMWEKHCRDQLPAGELMRPDIELEENGTYPLSFGCSLLREIRSTGQKEKTEFNN